MKTAGRLRRALLRWYDAHRRRLPWREHPSPYRTWISEIMLQQTQVATVLPYYERFLKRFPDISALARAEEGEVLKYWAGLGYYSRARNLRRTAQEIVEKHGGRFPDSWDQVLSLPGVGRYTAGAVLSIAYGQPHPAVDGNVQRVFARLFGIRTELKNARTRKRMWKLAEDLLERRRPGDWNQALMELGATVCLPESPRCGDCPLAARCVARRRGLQGALPRTARPRGPVRLRWTCLWIERSGKVLLWKRADSERFLPGHWALPEPRHLRSEPPTAASIARNGGDDGPSPSAPGCDGTGEARDRLAAVRHTITHHRVTLEVRRAAPPPRLPASARWVRRSDLGNRLVSSLWLKAVREVTLRRAADPRVRARRRAW